MTTIKQYIHFKLLALLLCSARLMAQEGLSPLGANLNYIYPDLKPTEQLYNNTNAQARAATATDTLPFNDDFSYAYKRKYPSPRIWLDSSVYVNSGFAKTPMSYGVATFDGLNEHGYPRSPGLNNFQLSFPSDTLTSRPINLQVSNSQTLLPSDKVGLSFYYQAGGNGDYPEKSDSLLLDFYKPTTRKWVNGIWYKNGVNSPNYNDSLFKRVFIPIKDPDFLKDSFQFRFRNYATTNGDFDHWNIDYIYLDRNRDSIADTVTTDVSFAGLPGPLLKGYSAVPYKQYRQNLMAGKNSVRIRNNAFSGYNIRYSRAMPLDANDLNNINNYTTADNLNPFRSVGYCSYTPISNPVIDSAFRLPNRNFDFEVKHTVTITVNTGGNKALFAGNDTLIQYQHFGNYYAFDDGSAEKGYYVLGAGGQMAVKITLNQTDTIVGARIYFSHVGNMSAQKFKLNVWAEGNNGPGNLIITDTTRVRYKDTLNREITEYAFNLPVSSRILGAGSYYVGFQQQVPVGTGINVGFDVNYDHHNSLYFNSGSGWTQSQFYGSLLLRPVFGSFNDKPLAIRKNTATVHTPVLIYPNPSSNWFIIESEQASGGSFEIYNMMGQCLIKGELNEHLQKVYTSDLNHGVYFILVKENGRTLHQQKLIISR